MASGVPGRVGLLLFGFALIALAFACAPRATPTPTPTPIAEVVQGGVLRLAQPGDPTSCDLAMWRGVGYQSVHPCNSMLNQLVRIDPYDHSRILPDLAERWESGEDGTLWTFYLAPNVRWHDGQPLTTDDVLFSLQRIMETPPGLQPGRAAPVAQYIQSVEAPSQNTVVVRTRFPAASFLVNLASVYVSIYPKHVVEAMAPPTMEAFPNVVGSGPFRFRAFNRGSSYEMERNRDYFVRNRPYLDGVTYLVMPNPATQFAALRAHQVDVIPIGITESQAKEIAESLSDRIAVQETATANFWAVQMNIKAPPFDDERVREAVKLALDRDAAIQFQGGGYGGAAMPPTGAWGLPESELTKLPGLGDKTQERARARELLAQAGLGGGLRVKMLSRSG
ncbi:MAG: ABC transporter substrate-binding protein, partial [Chloroflexota bacterium]|nr:ABC transporter substrate-binding protein [Chloroflexota bacterium]